MPTKKQIREYAKLLNPIDDPMFRKMAEEKEFCEEILRTILNDQNLLVLEAIPQWSGTNLMGRSIILDAKCVTGDGRQINIEIQKANDDDHQKRVRYHGAIITTNCSEPGTKFELVPDVCIVFISKFDIFEGNLPLYHIDRVVRETGKVVDNGFTEIYVNTVSDDGSDVAELMKVFSKDDSYSDKFPKTSEIKRRYKETEGGVQSMSDLMEKLRIEWITEGLEEGERKGLKSGLETGKNKTTQLFAILLKENRMTDLNRCISDPNYLDKMLEELIPPED